MASNGGAAGVVVEMTGFFQGWPHQYTCGTGLFCTVAFMLQCNRQCGCHLPDLENHDYADYSSPAPGAD